jgi:DNA-directed RNA polymerase specialized sigma24 family protein
VRNATALALVLLLVAIVAAAAVQLCAHPGRVDGDHDGRRDRSRGHRAGRPRQVGRRGAFADLYDRYVDQVFAYVYRRVGHRQLAEDLVGDVFLRAYRRLSSFEWQGVDLGAWIITIARNRVHDHFKSARFRLERATDEVRDEPTRASSRPATTPSGSPSAATSPARWARRSSGSSPSTAR